MKDPIQIKKRYHPRFGIVHVKNALMAKIRLDLAVEYPTLTVHALELLVEETYKRIQANNKKKNSEIGDGFKATDLF